MSTLALHPSQALKAWAGHVLTALRPASGGIHNQSLHAAGDDLVPETTFHGLPCLIQQSVHLLTSLWSTDEEETQQQGALNKHKDMSERAHSQGMKLSPLVWLGHFQAALQRITASDSKQSGGGGNPSDGQQDEVMRMILTALLDHPQPEVQAAAAEACGEAVQAFPISGISFLPLLIYKLQSSVDETQRGKIL